MGCHSFLQGIVPTQGSNPGLLCCRQTPYQQTHRGSPELCLPRANYKITGRFSTVWTAGMPNLHTVQGELYCVLRSELSRWTLSCCPDTTHFLLPPFLSLHILSPPEAPHLGLHLLPLLWAAWPLCPSLFRMNGWHWMAFLPAPPLRHL